ncbi:hypothetical protein AVEN_116224-1, partial [Araneus ventricosus]
NKTWGKYFKNLLLSDFVHCHYALAGYNGMTFTPWVTLPGEKTPDVHRPFHPGPPPPPR